jgi:hypothetical protein
MRLPPPLSKWFDHHEELQDEVDHRIQRAWKSSVLKPLRTAAGGDGDEQDGIHP